MSVLPNVDSDVNSVYKMHFFQISLTHFLRELNMDMLKTKFKIGPAFGIFELSQLAQVT